MYIHTVKNECGIYPHFFISNRKEMIIMLDTYTNTPQTIAADGILIFNINRVQTGCTATHAPGTGAISLNKPGFYIVHFNGDAAESGTAGNITVQLFRNGVLVPAAEATETSSATTDIANMSFETIVKVTPDCLSCGNSISLTFENTGVGAVFSNVEVVVTKLC